MSERLAAHTSGWLLFSSTALLFHSLGLQEEIPWPGPGLNHSSLTVASRSTIAPPWMDFTLPLYPEQNREGRQGGGGVGVQRGPLTKLFAFWARALFQPHLPDVQVPFFFSFFFSKELHGLTVSDSFLLSHSPALPADINNPCMQA